MTRWKPTKRSSSWARKSARYGGAYGVTKDLIKKFGRDRLLDTPISEAGIVGAAVGAAMTGLRPVVELMYVDFLGLTMDQLGNQAAKIRYMFGGQIGVPMVLRTAGRHRAKRWRATFAESRGLDHAYAWPAPRHAGDRSRTPIISCVTA